VIRGGSWNNPAGNCRSAYRNRNEPGNRNNNLGFRLVLLPAHRAAADAGLLTRTKFRSPASAGAKTNAVPGLVTGLDSPVKALAWHFQGGHMEVITVSAAIIAAVAAGVTDGVTAVGKQAILDTYEALKTAIKSRFGKESISAKAIEKLENNREEEGHQFFWKALNGLKRNRWPKPS
jgi:hypothetical protein